MFNWVTKQHWMLHEIDYQKNIFSRPKILPKLSNTNFKDWDMWVNKFNDFIRLGSKKIQNRNYWLWMIKFMFKIKKAKNSQGLQNFYNEKTFWMKKIDKNWNFTKMLNYWHIMDLKMWFYFYKKPFGCTFRNRY